MANQKERTLDELLRKSKKLIKIRPSCVLEGNARMRGPGVKDEEPSDATAVREGFCDICGSQGQEIDLRICSTCGRGFHTSCLGRPMEESVGVDWLCSECQGTHSGTHQASDSSRSLHEERAMTCTLDSKSDRQGQLLKDDLLSGLQLTSCLSSKSVARVEDAVEKTLEQPDRELGAMETGSHYEKEKLRKSGLGSGEASEQSPTLENVRRSKRGRPYKPVGGLHPNKRRSVDGIISRQPDKAQQGRSKLIVDEEDELGAKIEKFRVISSIDEKSVRKGPPDWEDSKKADFGQALKWDEEDGSTRTMSSAEAQEGQTRPPRKNAEINLGLESPRFASKGRTLEEGHNITGVSARGSVDRKSPGGIVHNTGQGKSYVERAVLKVEHGGPERLAGGSLAPNDCQTDGQAREGGHSVQTRSQQTIPDDNLGTDRAEQPRHGQVTKERFVVTKSPTSHEVVTDKGSSKSASASSDTFFVIKMAEKVYPASSRLETPGSFLTPPDTSNDVHIVSDCGFVDSMITETTKFCNKVSEDELKTVESSKADDGDEELRKLVSHVKDVGMEDFVGKAISKVQEAVLAGHPKALARDASEQREPKISRVETTGKGETGDKVIPTAVTAIATAGLVHSGGNTVDSTDKMSKRDLPLGTSSSPELVGKGTRGLQITSLEEEDDVKVCDICGDAGYEECLTVCNVCNEGAEHIYCMQVLLHAVPEHWLCEICQLKENNGNLKKVDLPVNQVPSKAAYTSPKKGQFIKGNTRSRLSALLDKCKGSSSQKIVTKGPSTNQLSTKRPADDAQTPSMKRQVRENIGIPSTVTNAITPRGLTRENSVKAPDSGKVKFLSPNALATNPSAGGSRSFSKSSSFAGLPSQSVRPGMNQVSQVPSKNRYVLNSYAPGDSLICGASPSTKQSPPAPRPPPFNATAPTLPAGRGAGSVKSHEPLPSFLLPSRTGPSAIAKGSKEGNSEGSVLHSFGRDTNSMSTGGGSAKGFGASSSGKLTTKWIDTPRPTQSTSFGRQLSGRVDPSINLQSLDNNVMPGRPLVQKRSQTVDATKGLTNMARWPSLGRISNQQGSRDEAQRNSEVQPLKGPRQPPKAIDSVDPGTWRGGSLLDLSTNCNKLLSEGSADVDLGRKGDQQIRDVPKIQKWNSSGTVAVNSQKSTSGSPHSSEVLVGEVGTMSSKARRLGSPAKQSVVDATPKDLPNFEKGSKTKDNSEIGWSPASLMGPAMSRRCYTCTETGHSAQDCSARSIGTPSLPDLHVSNSKGHGAISMPKESLGGLSSSLLGQRQLDCTPLGVPKSAAESSVDRVSTSPLLHTECTGSVPVTDTATVVQQGQSREAETGIVGKVSMFSTEDKKKRIPTSLSLNQGGTVPRLRGQSGPFAASAPSWDLQSAPVGKATEALDLETSFRTDGASPAPISVSQVSQPDGFAAGDLAAPGTSIESQRSDTIAKTVQGGSPKLSGEQVAVKQTYMTGASVTQVLPPPPPLPPPPLLGRGWGENRPFEPPVASPMSRLMKGPVPWGQLASARPFLGVDRVVNQDTWGKRFGSVVGPGIGASAPWNPSPKAVPESQCLWRGGFEVITAAAVPAFYDGIQAYSSSFAAPQVRAVTKTLPHRLQLEEVRRMYNADAWPKQFQQRHPTDKEIALYFFPMSESCGGGYTMLLEHMKTHDLVLMGQVEGAELLIFPSHLLPVEFHHWKSKMFLWGVYRARRSNPVLKPMLPDSVQTSVQVPVDSAIKVVPHSEPEKEIRHGTAVTSSSADAGEVDMEIDIDGDKELCIQSRDWSQKAVCDQPPLVKFPPPVFVTPPLPHDPPPLQPPPPDLTAPFVQEMEAAQVISLTGISSKECGPADVDLPPGFGPGARNRVPSICQPLDVNNTPSGPSELKPDSHAPLGFDKLKEGASTIPTQVHAEEPAGSTIDADSPELTSNQLILTRGSNAAERSWPSMSSRRTSPFLHPSPSPRDLREDSAGSFWLSTPKHSRSGSKSPKRHRDRMKDHGGGRTSFDGRESGKSKDSSRRESGRGREIGRETGPAREGGRDRDRERGRDSKRGMDRDRGGDRESGRAQEKGRDRERERERELDRETRREKDKERRRDRWHHHKEREKSREGERSAGRDWGKKRDHRPESRGRGRERKYQRRSQSPSRSRSRSRSFSNSGARLESLSISPPKRRSSGKSHSLHRSRSYSDSPESIHGSLWRKPRSSDGPSASREHSQDGSSSGRRVNSRLNDIDRDGKPTARGKPDGEVSLKSKLTVFSREGSIKTRDFVKKENVLESSETLGTSSCIPFYGIQEDEAETVNLDRGKEKTSVESCPVYHVFLPGESDDMQMFENGAGDHEAERPVFRNIRLSPDALKQPKSDTVQSSGLWKSDKAIEKSGFEFFPVRTENVGDSRKLSTNPNLELGLGDTDVINMQEPEPQPFFVDLADKEGSSPEPAHRYTGSLGPHDMTVEFPLVTGRKEAAAKAEVGSLSLSLAVPQYRKEGNAWVKIEDAQAMLGDDDVNFALTL